MRPLFHITTRDAWRDARGSYRAPSLDTEGFLHLSTEAQWPRTAARFFTGRTDLLLLTIDPAALDAEVRFEQADGEAFPHLYGALPVDAVRSVEALAVDARGIASLSAV